MTTKNRRVAAYLPPQVDEKLRAFKIDRGLATQDDPHQNDSQALIQILSEFFEVSHEVVHPLSSELACRIEYLEEKVAHLSRSADERFQSLFTEVASLRKIAIKSKDELLGELKSELVQKTFNNPDQLNLLTNDRQNLDSPSELSSELPNAVSSSDTTPMSGEALCQRFHLSRSTVKEAKRRYKDNPEKFVEWARQRDPDGLGWEYRAETRKYHPIP